MITLALGKLAAAVRDADHHIGTLWRQGILTKAMTRPMSTGSTRPIVSAAFVTSTPEQSLSDAPSEPEVVCSLPLKTSGDWRGKTG